MLSFQLCGLSAVTQKVVAVVVVVVIVVIVVVVCGRGVMRRPFRGMEFGRHRRLAAILRRLAS